MNQNRNGSRQQAKQEGDNEMIARINYEFPKGLKFTEFTELGADNDYIIAVIDDALRRGADNVTVSRSSIEEIKADSYELGEQDGAGRQYDDLITELGRMNAAERNRYITEEYEASLDKASDPSHEVPDDFENTDYHKKVDQSIEVHETLKKKFGKTVGIEYA